MFARGRSQNAPTDRKNLLRSKQIISPDRFQRLSGIFYLCFIIRVKIKVSTIIKRTKNDPYTILPFSICSAVGKDSKEPKTSRKISSTMTIATTIEKIIQKAFFHVLFSFHRASFAFVLQRLRAKPIPLKLYELFNRLPPGGSCHRR